MIEEEWLRNLENSLEIFTEEQKEIEVDIQRKRLEEKIQSGLTEEEAIKSLGTIEEIQKEILKKHGINPEKIIKKNNFFYQKFEELFEAIHRVVDTMGKNNFKENVKIILDLLVLIFFICLIKIPFILIRNLGDSLLLSFELPSIILNIWSLIIDIIYIIVAIMIFMNIFTKWFKNLKGKNKKKIKGKSLEAVSLEEKDT